MNALRLKKVTNYHFFEEKTSLILLRDLYLWKKTLCLCCTETSRHLRSTKENVFFFRKVSFEELVVSWSSLRDLRDLIIGYRVIINGKEITEVENYETEYVFTLGQMCREYKFEVQALANHEYLDSEVSKPLVILWPGIITPDIYEVMTTTGNAIKIAWSRPFSSKNVKILGYWVSFGTGSFSRTNFNSLRLKNFLPWVF